ncbi:hypothetical protein DBV15_08183 [Temnothorax longispinosus]|uniref:Uncharacterized protein n=1 Tax=Temnothorax longispinosus TaxID=300112 RepID=A0A4S2KW29_9HYME|nr:hypothetical protein DBV15_08183 [Temnothorax longispinosus]
MTHPLAYFLGHKEEQGDGECKWLQRDLVRRLSSSARSQLVCMQASWQSCENPRPCKVIGPDDSTTPFLSNDTSLEPSTNDFDISQLITSNSGPTGLHVSEEGFCQQGPVILPLESVRNLEPNFCVRVLNIRHIHTRDVPTIMGQRLEQEH